MSRISQAFLNVLRAISSRLEDARIDWAITGSLGFALQGVPVDLIHDIDVQTDADGAYEIERRFANEVIRKVAFSSTATMRSHLGLLRIDGIDVEIMGDISKRLSADLAWDVPVELSSVKRWVEIEGMRVPVLDLEYECQAYLKMGRREKAKLLRDWLDHHCGVILSDSR